MMRPVFNPQSNQVQTNGTPASAPQPQVLESNKKVQPNSINLLPQIQSQIGLINPQTPSPFSNPNTQLANMNPSFLNVPNQFFQNGMFPLGQFPNGFGPQNLNNMGMNQFNMTQLNGQIFTPNVMNQGVSLPNGQFFMQNPLQNMGQFVQVPMLNVPFIQNQASQIRGPQNPSFNGNQQFGVMNYNGVSIQSNQQQNPSNSSQPLQGNSSLRPVFGSVQPQQTQNFQPQVFNNQQGNPINDNLINNMANIGRNSQSKNFERHPRQDKSQGFTKSQTHHMQNAKGKFKTSNGRGAKGFQNEWSRKSILPDPSNGTPVEKKRLLPLNYTEQEIQQWREARKRHYPSKTNIEKKSKKKMAEAEVADMEAKLRRQQLKEVLVKQAELGCEVAEIPSHYLSDSEKPIIGAEHNRPAFNKKGRSRNRSNKRGRHENDRCNKKQRPSNNNPAATNNNPATTNDQNVSKEMQRTKSNDTSLVKKEPTLLQKLLSADIRRDRNRLLQVFRFMVMNSFFKDHPQKPIMFPTVIVRENQGEGELAEGKTSHADEDHIDAQVDEVEDVCEEENKIDKAFVGAPEEGEIMY